MSIAKALRQRVLHVIPSVAPRYGGPSAVVVLMCRALCDQGIDVVLATTDADGPGRLPVSQGAMGEYEGVPAIFFARQFSESFKFSRPLSRWLLAHVTEFDCVHVHSVFSHSSLAAARACRRRSVPYIVRPLGSLENWSLRRKPVRKRIALALGARKMLTNAAAIHYTTEKEKRESEEMVGLTKGVVIPLGVDLTPALDVPPQSDLTPSSRTPLSMWRGEADRGHPGETSPPLHLERGQGGEVAIEQSAFARSASADESRNRAMNILFLSRLHPKKGVELLLEAFARVIARNAVTPAEAGVARGGQLGTTGAIPAFAGMTGEAAGVAGANGQQIGVPNRAIEQSSNRAIPSRLIIAGSGEPAYEQHLHRLAKSLGIAESVTFPGWLDGEAKAAALARAELFVLPSAQENFGLSVLEAMAAGIPVAVSREVDLSDEVKALQAGWVFDRTESSLESALREALSDAGERRRRGRLGRDAVEKRYLWSGISKEIERLYDTVCESGRNPADLKSVPQPPSLQVKRSS